MMNDRRAKRSVIGGEAVCELKAQEWVCMERHTTFVMVRGSKLSVKNW